MSGFVAEQIGMETYTWTAVIVAVSLQWSAVALAYINGSRRLARVKSSIDAVGDAVAAAPAAK